MSVTRKGNLSHRFRSYIIAIMELVDSYGILVSQSVRHVCSLILKSIAAFRN